MGSSVRRKPQKKHLFLTFFTLLTVLPSWAVNAFSEVLLETLNVFFQYYRQGRQHALHTVYPELALEEAASAGRLNYPRPLSEPPSPTSSRATTPAPSEHGSDDEDAEDSIDSEAEVGIRASALSEECS